MRVPAVPKWLALAVLWLVIVFIVWQLVACATLGNAPAPLLLTQSGEQPSVCYVRARQFHGLVPMSCRQAEAVRP